MWKNKYTTIKGAKISYWENEETNNPVVILPGGAINGSHLESFIKYYNPKFRVISFDYPGRGNSGRYPEHEGIKEIGILLAEGIKEIVNEPVLLIGHSLGTAISREIALSNICQIRALINIQPGEFFPKIYRELLKVLFWPARISERVRRLYWRSISNKTHLFDQDVITESQQASLLSMWYATLSYEIDGRVCSLPTILCNSVRDSIIDGHSRDKLLRVYSTSRVIYFNAPHFFDWHTNRYFIEDILQESAKYYDLDFLSNRYS